MTRAEVDRARVGDKLLFRPRFTRQYVHGTVIGVTRCRYIVDYGVDSDFGKYRTTQAVPWRRIVTVYR